jgi:polygalacturonase
MEVKIANQTSRNIVIEICDGGVFNTKQQYTLFVNKKLYSTTERIITGIYGLKPDTQYHIEVEGKEETAEISIRTAKESYSLDVRAFGAKGDGIHDDTCCIQAAIMACPKDGRVYLPEGTYRITSLFLKSNLNLEIGKGAVLKADSSRENRPIMPGRIQSYDENDEYNLGTWEGNPLDMFAGVIHGMDVENVVIYGQGVIDGGADKTNWWLNPKKRNIAWRPRLIFLNHCRNITIEGVQIQNSPSWTIHPYFCENLRFVNLNIINPKDSPNTDALDPESCKQVEILGIYFSVGDDCIALKSGKIYMGAKYKTPSEDITIRQCCMRDGHGSVTIGSEMSGGVRNITVRDCLFINTDRGLRIKTRRGRGKDAVIDNIVFENIRMDGVMTPLAINCFYFCDPDGHTSYVQNREPLLVDDRTPQLRRLYFRNIECKNCHIAAVYIQGLPEQKIKELSLENITFSFAEEALAGVPEMLDGIQSVSKLGICINNVEKLLIQHVTVDGHTGEVFLLQNIKDQQFLP